MQEVAETAKRKIIFWWLTHCYLRRIGKRYPDHFETVIKDITDNVVARRIMRLRYTGDNPLKFEAIAYEVGIDIRNVFAHHKNIIDKIIDG